MERWTTPDVVALSGAMAAANSVAGEWPDLFSEPDLHSEPGS